MAQIFRVKIYKDLNGEWRWQMTSANGNIVADSSEGYKNRIDAIREIENIKNMPIEVESDTDEGN